MSRHRLVLLSSTLAGAFALAASGGQGAYAQAGAAAAGAAPAAQPAPAGGGEDELVVTGTRLRLPEYTQPNPVTSVTSEAIELSGETNVTEILEGVPALVSSIDQADSSEINDPAAAGLNLLDLRNLGTDRTLVLVNGRRHVAAYPGTAAVDVNTIPPEMIERVEVLTGGASAVYGADGVSGVVNFIMRKDFDGAEVRAQTGRAWHGAGVQEFVGAVVGKNFLDKRANLTVSFDYAHDADLKFSDRDYTEVGHRVIMVTNPNDPGSFGGADDPNLPDLIPATNVHYFDTSRAGSIYTRFRYPANQPFAPVATSGVSFLGDGSHFQDGIYTGGFTEIGGSGSGLDDYQDDLLSGQDRMIASASGHFDLSDKFKLFGEFKYAETKTDFEEQPSYDYGLFIGADNPYIPADALYDASHWGGLATGKGSADFGLPKGVLVARDNFDLGRAVHDIDRKTLRFVVGFEGDLSPNFSYQASYTYGRATQHEHVSNVRILERWFAATDVVIDPATGRPTCRSNLDPTAVPIGDIFAQFPFDPSTFGTTFTPGPNSGCVPTSVFGDGAVTQAARDWINTDVNNDATLQQHVANAYVTGNTGGFIDLPAGPLSFVVGGEYRKELSDFRPDPIELLADELEYPITNAGRASRTKGAFDVKEAFAELSVPVIKDHRFFKSLTLNGAYRYSNYDTSGGTSTWNVGGDWQVSDLLMLRATKARAVRAPNIVNLFQGRQQTFSFLADPCSVENVGIGDNPTQRKINCTADLSALGIDPATFINNSSESIGGFIRGNPDLKPEKADTWTAGFVLTPPMVRGLSISADYYDITIKDAIQSYSAQTIVNNCYDLPAGARDNFCALITRSQPGAAINPGRIISFEQVPGNIASYKTAGVDFTARYRLNPANFGLEKDIGTFTFSLIGNRLTKLVFVEASGAPPDSDVGEYNAPRWQLTFDLTWRYKNFTANYGFNYFSHTLAYSPETLAAQPDYVDDQYKYYPSRHEHDIQLRYQLRSNVEVYGGCNNVGDQQPLDWGSYIYPVSPMGRFFYVGVKASL